jgi:ligand-binding SRPBCC domain-containing protein
MKYQHRFRVQTALADVAEFHTQSASMGAITPPPAVIRFHEAPICLTEGDKLDFTMWLGPVPIRWLACIEEVTPRGFVDRQLSGPFQHWVHRHRFAPVGETETEVIDEIDFSLRAHPWWGLVGLGMGLTLPLLFAFRGWKTRRLLESQRTVRE